MTNTYDDNAPLDIKIYEELRLIRCLHERILRAINEGEFPDYQMKKFSGNALSRKAIRDRMPNPSKTLDNHILKELKHIRETHEILLNAAGKCLFEDYEMEKTNGVFKAPGISESTPKIENIRPGDILYIDSDDDKAGGQATVKFIVDNGKGVIFVKFRGTTYNLGSLLKEQTKLKKEFGNEWAHYDSGNDLGDDL
jgi:hypothetical protein